MRLTEREKEGLLIYTAAMLAKRRLKKGMKLSFPETVALLSFEVMEAARTGKYTVPELQVFGRKILSKKDVMDGVPALIPYINIDATFPDGTKLVVLWDPFNPSADPSPAEIYDTFDGIDTTPDN